MPLVLLVLLALLAARPVEAQRLGAYGGFMKGMVSSEQLGSFAGSRAGFVAGVFLEAGSDGALGLRVGAQYAQKGLVIEVPDDGSGEDFVFEVGVDYVEIPVLVAFSFPTEGRLGAHVFAGPVPAFKTRCDVEFRGDAGAVSAPCGSEEDLEVDDAVKSFDLGVMLGGGLSWAVGGARLLGDVGYNIGIKSFVEDDASAGGESIDNKHRTLSVTGGASFPIGD